VVFSVRCGLSELARHRSIAAAISSNPQRHIMKTWIKFCGTTSLDDALASIEAGADALGFIFTTSKRRVTMEQAREIFRGLPDRVERIGVFLDESAESIRRYVTELNLTGVQLHGNTSAGDLSSSLGQKHRENLRIVRTIVISSDFAGELKNLEAAKDAVDAWLLDSGAGSGNTFDWRAVREALGDREGRLVIAGGLKPENVGEAMRVFNPWGVDVVSGIEREPGRKDQEKMRAFVAAVRKAEEQ
jgi:phosphoribosylanthranilate isomerase